MVVYPIDDMSARNAVQPDKGFHQHRLARSRLPDDHVHLPVVHLGAHMVKHRHTVFKGLYYVFYFDHCLFRIKDKGLRIKDELVSYSQR